MSRRQPADGSPIPNTSSRTHPVLAETLQLSGSSLRLPADAVCGSSRRAFGVDWHVARRPSAPCPLAHATQSACSRGACTADERLSPPHMHTVEIKHETVSTFPVIQLYVYCMARCHIERGFPRCCPCRLSTFPIWGSAVVRTLYCINLGITVQLYGWPVGRGWGRRETRPRERSSYAI